MMTYKKICLLMALGYGGPRDPDGFEGYSSQRLT